MAGVLDRFRRLLVNGRPVATGLVAVGDAMACTNPSGGRGMTLGLLGVWHLREVIRSHLENPHRLAETWDAVAQTELTPWYAKPSKRIVPGSPRSKRSAAEPNPRLRAASPSSSERCW